MYKTEHASKLDCLHLNLNKALKIRDEIWQPAVQEHQSMRISHCNLCA